MSPKSERERRSLAFLLKHLPAVESRLLATVALAGVALLVFLFIASEVVEGETAAWDRRLLLALRNPSNPDLPWGPRWLQELARDFTAMGGVGVVSLMTGVTVVYLWLERKRHAALAIAVAVVGGLMVSTLLKLGFDRARPDLVPHGSFVYTTSFPSGHSMLAAVTYLTLGAMLARVHAAIRMKVFLLSVACFLTAAIGLSRVYLGVHWPSDVLAGWTVGAAWAFGCAVAMQWLQRRGEVEKPEA